jgi:aspartyl-tRNA(Asn)/glutamyl-tRNA(Gln) amidotransferase subunit C
MVTKDDVLKIAKLARLQIHESELEKFTGQMNQILEFVNRLNQLDTTGIVPTSHAIEITNAFREDEVVENNLREKVFESAPEHEANFFRVPKVI